MAAQKKNPGKEFEKALAKGRPPNVVRRFPNSRALIVSGKAVDRAMLAKGSAMTIAANGRSSFVIRGALRAAQRANAAIIIEIAKSESTYCMTSMFNLPMQVDSYMNEMGITVPVAVHADHYGIKSKKDLDTALTEIPAMFDACITSIAIDASHLPDDENLLANLKLAPLVPSWSGYETEVGEIKGKEGLSTPAEALFLIQGLNAHGLFPDWIALNNGTTHGIEASSLGIQVGLTAKIHQALAPYKMSGAQHGTSGNNSARLREIAKKTQTTKANVATALQMVSWGVKVNEFGNAFLDKKGNFVKIKGRGMDDAVWAEMVAYAEAKGMKAGDYKKLNLPFESRLLAQPAKTRERMVKAVEDFVYDLLVNVFNARNTAPLAVKAICKAGSHDLGPKAKRTEDAKQWTPAKIRARARAAGGAKGPGGDYDD